MEQLNQHIGLIFEWEISFSFYSKTTLYIEASSEPYQPVVLPPGFLHNEPVARLTCKPKPANVKASGPVVKMKSSNNEHIFYINSKSQINCSHGSLYANFHGNLFWRLGLYTCNHIASCLPSVVHCSLTGPRMCIYSSTRTAPPPGTSSV